MKNEWLLLFPVARGALTYSEMKQISSVRELQKISVAIHMADKELMNKLCLIIHGKPAVDGKN